MNRLAAPAFFAVVVGAGVLTQTPLARAEMSDRVVAYRIEVRLDPVKHTLHGREALTWRNVTSKPARDLLLHLY
ncbi:MAG TPA: hypothetical protein VFE84_12925, partial [Patescibacteria group bacterium]|nr:hypothetical protein [Patescibacteria group bacterium]